jgi:hypothetical protein
MLRSWGFEDKVFPMSLADSKLIQHNSDCAKDYLISIMVRTNEFLIPCPLDKPRLAQVSLPGNNVFLHLCAFPICEAPSLQQIEYRRHQ